MAYENRIYNVAVVGCGDMGIANSYKHRSIPFTYSFAGAAMKHPRTKLVALVDTDEEKLRQARGWVCFDRPLWPGVIGDSLEKVVEACYRDEGTRIDVVCCAAGPAANAEVIRKAASLGIKGVYCEKPLSLSLSEAGALALLEVGSPVKIQVNYMRNFDPSHRAVLEHIKEGGIGELLMVRVLYKGGILAVAPHALALLELLFSVPLAVSGVYSPLINTRAPEDPNIDGTIRYAFGPYSRPVHVSLMATGRGELENNTYLFELEFTGTEGRVSILENGSRLRYERMEPSRVYGSLGTTMPYETQCVPWELKPDSPKEYLLQGLGNLVDVLDRRPSAKLYCNAFRAYAAEEVAHALAISAENEGRILSLMPLTDKEHTFAASVAGVTRLKTEAGLR